MNCVLCQGEKEGEVLCICKNLILCRNHMGHHILESGHNSCEILDLTLSPTESNLLRQNLFEKLMLIEKSKAGIFDLAKNLIKIIESQSKEAITQLDKLEQSYSSLLKYTKLSISLKKEVDRVLSSKLKIKEVFVDIGKTIQEAFNQGLILLIEDKKPSKNLWVLKEKQIYMESLNINHYQEWFARNGLKKRFVIEIKISNDERFSFICMYYLGKSN